MAWGYNTDADGVVHLRLRKVGTAFELAAFRDNARTLQVAIGTRNTVSGPLALGASAKSGLTGTLTIRYVADASTIAIAAVPAVLAWRLARLRAQWREQDAVAGSSPIVDPDLIAETDLAHPNVADPAFQSLKNRRDFLAAKLAELRAATPAAHTILAKLDAMLTAARLPVAQLQALAARLAQGQNITADLDALRLSPAAFAFLMRIRKLAEGNGTVLDTEWTEVELILVQALKRDALAGWRAEEQQMQISPLPRLFPRRR